MFNENHLLLYAIFTPFVAGLVLLACGRELSSRLARVVAWVGFLTPAAVALCAWYVFAMRGAQLPVNAYILNAVPGGAPGSPALLFPIDISTGLDFWHIRLTLGLDGLSLPMFVLSGLVGLAAGIYALSTNPDRPCVYWGLLLFIVSGAMGVFASLNLFYFYFFHEFALIPTFILIGWWGGAGGRSAALEMTIYLTLGAMLSLIGLLALYTQSDAAGFDLISLRAWALQPGPSAGAQHAIFGLLMFGFGILVSLWPFHSWAPGGYAAAPAPAAMLHAGVLKKFGLYGLLQIAVPLLPSGMQDWGRTLAWLALGNIVIIGAVTIAQRDLKVMLGYSSVMHMGYIFLGIACVSALGAGGAVLLMFAHGLSIAALFLLSDAVYTRTRTFDLTAMGGLCQKAPVLAGFFVAATFAGIGLPGFANFWGEFTVFVALWQYSPWMVALAALGVVISAVYGLRAVSRVFYGEPTAALQPLMNGAISDIRPGERWPAVILLGALMLVGLWPSSMTRGINEALPAAYKLTVPSAEKSVIVAGEPRPSAQLASTQPKSLP